MKHLLFLLFLLLEVPLFSQVTNADLIPENTNRIGISILGTSFLNLSCEYKLKSNITIVPKVGVGFVYQSGTNFITRSRFSEFGLFPVLDADFRYYTSLTNKNRKGQITKVFSGSYISILPHLSLPLIGGYEFIESKADYGLRITIGKQIEKISNWNFNYYIGYSLFSKYIDNGANTSINNFRAGLTLGYTL